MNDQEIIMYARDNLDGDLDGETVRALLDVLALEIGEKCSVSGCLRCPAQDKAIVLLRRDVHEAS